MTAPRGEYDEQGLAPDADQHPEWEKRVYNQPAPPLEKVDHDEVAHSKEAMKILVDQGADAYREFVNRKRRSAEANPDN